MMRKRSLLKEVKINYQLFLMVAPAVIFFFIFSYLPMTGVYFAFTNFNFADGLWRSPFVGLKNFEFLVNNDILLNITKNTILYNIAFIVFGSGTSILAAIILSEIKNRYFVKIAQSVMFLPYFISFVLVSAFVYNIFNYEYGLLNSIRNSLGMEPVNVYQITGIWKYIIVTFHIWKQLGYGTVIYLATIISIDASLFESADIDGANVFQKIWHITVPHIVPTFITILIFNIGSIMRGQFDLFWNIIGSNGNLYNATDIIDTFVYRTLTQKFDMGMATAAGLFQSVFGLIIVLTVNGIIRKKQREYALF